MRVIRCAVTIGEDHTLHVQLPEDVPPGPAEVVVEIPDPVGGEGAFGQFLDLLDHQPRQTRSKEDIDRELQAERDSWEKP